MGEKDTIDKLIFDEPDLFADLFNMAVYRGEQVIKPELLKPADTTIKDTVPVKYKGEIVQIPVVRYRDVFKSLHTMEDENAIYMFYAVENQSEQDPYMASHVQFYDAFFLEIQRKRVENGKQDKIKPVKTLVLNLSGKPWTGPRSTYEMFGAENFRQEELPSNYQITVVDPAEIPKEILEKSQTDLDLFFAVMALNPDFEAIKRFAEENIERFSHLDERINQGFKAHLGAKIEVNKDEEVKVVFPVIEDATRRATDEFAYTLLSSNLVSAEDLINNHLKTREDINRILKEYGQKDKENPDK